MSPTFTQNHENYVNTIKQYLLYLHNFRDFGWPYHRFIHITVFYLALVTLIEEKKQLITILLLEIYAIEGLPYNDSLYS